MATRTIEELRQLQALPLDVKVQKTKLRIQEWVEEFGIDGVYVSFSGGKDSTVLLTIARELYPEITAVFVDTGLEYPEIRDFVKTFENVDWVKPKMTFKQVIEKYGYPFISKEVAIRAYWAASKPGGANWGIFYGAKAGTRYDLSPWRWVLNCPFSISAECCNTMKKTPAKKYEKKTSRTPIIGMLAEESMARISKWLQEGCNAFNNKRPSSNPMSFWTDQDVLHYIKKNNIKLASVYGEIVYEDADGMQYSEPMFFDDMKLTTTGCKRTGCMFCGFGCHLEKPGKGRFELMKKTHPQQYEYIMKPWSKGGLDYKNVIDWLNENGNLHIRY